jgi:hypothetical protein
MGDEPAALYDRASDKHGPLVFRAPHQDDQLADHSLACGIYVLRPWYRAPSIAKGGCGIDR